METPNHFDRSKPFYPLVVNYIVQLIGFKELALRGLIGPPEGEGRLSAFLHRYPRAPHEESKVRSDLEKIGGPLELRAEFQNNNITVDIDEMAQDIVENHTYLLRTAMPTAGSIFIVAYETAKERGWRDHSPLWEFLRHCRNAAAHGGLFTFRGHEPSRPARWGHLDITRDLEGMTLFKDADANGFLSPGDPIRLLWDLEQETPRCKPDTTAHPA